ncbi:hypothetical protein F5887DRAFT_328494 [Amanita rubescens]|nr:hypothetical protein F5887DRAFT_328494 [Amanita rubescens]
MSLRQEMSVTTNTSRPQAAVFRQALLGRDRACVISQTSYPIMLTGSHLAPRRLGDAGVRSVIQRFTGFPSTVNRYHHTLGVLLLKTLDSAADNYELGFWHRGPGHQYVVHNFYEAPLTTSGTEPLNPNDQMLHDYPITLTTHNNLRLPPAGLFNWHYLQCVLKRFAT